MEYRQYLGNSSKKNLFYNKRITGNKLVFTHQTDWWTSKNISGANEYVQLKYKKENDLDTFYILYIDYNYSENYNYKWKLGKLDENKNFVEKFIYERSFSRQSNNFLEGFNIALANDYVITLTGSKIQVFDTSLNLVNSYDFGNSYETFGDIEIIGDYAFFYLQYTASPNTFQIIKYNYTNGTYNSLNLGTLTPHSDIAGDTNYLGFTAGSSYHFFIVPFDLSSYADTGRVVSTLYPPVIINGDFIVFGDSLMRITSGNSLVWNYGSNYPKYLCSDYNENLYVYANNKIRLINKNDGTEINVLTKPQPTIFWSVNQYNNFYFLSYELESGGYYFFVNEYDFYQTENGEAKLILSKKIKLNIYLTSDKNTTWMRDINGNAFCTEKGNYIYANSWIYIDGKYKLRLDWYRFEPAIPTGFFGLPLKTRESGGKK